MKIMSTFNYNVTLSAILWCCMFANVQFPGTKILTIQLQSSELLYNFYIFFLFDLLWPVDISISCLVVSKQFIREIFWFYLVTVSWFGDETCRLLVFCSSNIVSLNYSFFNTVSISVSSFFPFFIFPNVYPQKVIDLVRIYNKDVRGLG